MALIDDLALDVNITLNQEWNIRGGIVVPRTKNVTLTGGAVRLNATMLYADLADSTELAMQQDRRVSAKVFKSFLRCTSRIIRARGGSIRSFDGDRVMGVFLGRSKNFSAVKCAFNINYAFLNIIKPKLEAKYSSLSRGTFKLAQCVGIDTSKVLVVRSGIQDNNDLVWVGRAPNVAAKLSGIRNSPYHTYITKEVFDSLDEGFKYSKTKNKKKLMWEPRAWKEVSGVNLVYRSNWSWRP
ncbi:adenylate/guanylate cyclase domain-containing protein [Leptolyngbya sp. FACHB-261]|uniref:adenylate/guanylate cyclase domain-containing protein n=1 Tax=Leptolyngbya sp. FACHB-261 TaxID=2692806 RepID=UPI001685EF97|nr:adenylate/guanylate cyclase domain-containing protein [Leptolyngbya sp. FACHB-261]MBD2100274.1 adenylate/guanylate cyclase domain-containing protein [Leptolyngbya sp. FACHB-261]